ncbi:DUF4331 family protein [Fimbriimonas ginsengisoli]|uniref:DUF4331 domain-containing protein n=1 Tax=Fimbriimonas ginsengisoli Gsoil 348 TaxID=661478 RepID=A0A068NPK6_FIMGI|nr:DUF4331 family protein [Fimbriimonas ginsengisoli]AIE85381.1 hypothetical protein OP10G_2013 [Fimbriimonas ginsengisoli Gsoil 348]
MTHRTKKYIALGMVALLAPLMLIGKVRASDHADTPDIAANPGTDITDVYMFPSPTNADNIVLVMNVHPLIGSGEGTTVGFDPNVLYQFKIDNNGDGVEDKVIQAKFTGAGAAQTVSISGPVRPSMTGKDSVQETPLAVHGTLNAPFSPKSGMTVFAGGREDPFFFDLEQFLNIFPDRATPLTGTPVADPNTPKQSSWRAPGVAKDFLSTGKYNVLSIVVELPKRSLQ